MKKNLLLFFLGIVFCVAQAIAQSKTITGKVVAAEDGLPLPGVSVKIKGTTTGTQTNPQGIYTINASSGQTLVFSFIGTVTQEIPVGTTSTIDVSLKQDTRTLQEAVVTGFGVKQSKRDLTSSTQTITGAAIAETQRENLVNALQGRIAGATVTSTSGVPGASASIVLRGITSIGGSNQPLFVVDGIRVNNDALSQGALASNGDNR
uniref:carboxypeptidase-like regulatory domain-containing protein n=1 Tax=uncultured Mucilaginibacter sp. TaxID=797541 RepID=UPI0026086376